MEIRLQSKIRKTKDCWLWTASRDTTGYGQFPIKGKPRKGAHKVVYELLKGEVPKGLTLDHLCKIRHCVNPDHMEIVTWSVNILRGNGPPAQNARKAKCKRGHLFDGRTPNGKARYCNACKRLNWRKLKDKRSK
jgi:hypothetical protein